MKNKLILIVLYLIHFQKFKLEKRSDFFDSKIYVIPIKFFELLENFIKDINFDPKYTFVKIEGWSLHNHRIEIEPKVYRKFRKKRLRKDVFFSLGKGLLSGFSFVFPSNFSISITLDQKNVPFANMKLLHLANEKIISKFSDPASYAFIDSFYPIYRIRLGNISANFLQTLIKSILIRNIGVAVRYSSKFNFFEISEFCRTVVNVNFAMDDLLVLRNSKNLAKTPKGWKQIVDTSPTLDYKKYEIDFHDEHFSQNVFNRTILSRSDSIQSKMPTQYSSCEVYPNGLVIKDGVRIHYDDSQNLYSDFNAGIHQFVVKNIYSDSTYVRNLPKINLSEISTISSKDDSNYFHFIIESLPKLFYNGKLNVPEFPLIVNSNTPRQFSDLIRALLPIDLVTLPKYSILDAANVEIFNPITCLPDSELLSNNVTSYIDESAVSAFKNYILENDFAQSSTKIDKVILDRQSLRRKCLNSKQILDFANAQGFVTVDPSKLTLVEQFALINNAKVVINFGGAAMANFIFANRDVKLITLLSSNLFDFHIPAILSKIAQANHFYVLGKPIKSKNLMNIYEKQHIDYYVDTGDLRSAISI
jgi:hypothetical protein